MEEEKINKVTIEYEDHDGNDRKMTIDGSIITELHLEADFHLSRRETDHGIPNDILDGVE